MAIPDGLPEPGAPLATVATAPEQLSLRFRIAHLPDKYQARRLLDDVRSTIETRQDRQELIRLRGTRDVVWHDDPDPRVTIRIATYSAGERLRVAVESALRQTYANVEILVIGDACDDQTAAVAESYAADGVRFLNLPRRGQYPEVAIDRWKVAGAAPMNVALELAEGAWIAPCDDDDMLTDDHVEKLLDHALSHRLELVWSRAAMQAKDLSWSQTAPNRLQLGQISHGSVLYSADLRFMRYNRRAYLSGRPGDWELWRRMSRAGVRMGFLDELTYYHFY
jgi:glycosyltransferase involved in cell wall biosynthesis